MSHPIRCRNAVQILLALLILASTVCRLHAAGATSPDLNLSQLSRQAMGEWSQAEKTILQQDPKEMACVLFGNGSWNRYSVSARVRLLPEPGSKSPEAGLLLHYLDPDHYIAYSLQQKKGGLYAVLRIANKSPALSIVADQALVVGAPGDWHLLRAEVDGADVQAYLDGKPLLSFSFLGTPPPYNSQGVTWSPDPVHGWTGLLTNNSRAEFTAFRVDSDAHFPAIITPQKGRFDAQHHLLPRQSYAETMQRLSDWLLNSSRVIDTSIAPPAIQNEPPYLLASFARSDDSLYDLGGEFAFNHALLISGAVEYYVFTGNPAYLKMATETADWEIAHSTPSDWALPDLAPSFVHYKRDGTWDGQDWGYEPDKSAYMAVSWLKLYETTADSKYLDAAIRTAKTLMHLEGKDGSWPFRANARTGEVKYGYTCSQLWYVWLFERLSQVTGDKVYLAYRDRAFQWLMNNPVRTNEWVGLYGDIASGARSFDQWVAQETAIYLIDHRAEDPTYVDKAKHILDWVNRVLVVDYGFFPGIPGVVEQSQYRVVLTHHELRLAELYAKLWQATRDPEYKRLAIETANSVTWNLMADGKIRQGYFYHAWGIPLSLNFDDQFARLMSCIPETAPRGENHLLDSSALVKQIHYAPRQISYSTVGKSFDVLIVASRPSTVTSGTQTLSNAKVDQPQQVGWDYDPSTSLLRIRHPEGSVEIALQ
jgi:rhamnogalacturonyl hydrolase YesR